VSLVSSTGRVLLSPVLTPQPTLDDNQPGSSHSSAGRRQVKQQVTQQVKQQVKQQRQRVLPIRKPADDAEAAVVCDDKPVFGGGSGQESGSNTAAAAGGAGAAAGAGSAASAARTQRGGGGGGEDLVATADAVTRLAVAVHCFEGPERGDLPLQVRSEAAAPPCPPATAAVSGSGVAATDPRCGEASSDVAHNRVRAEIMGAPKCRNVGESQYVLIMTEPMISTRTAPYQMGYAWLSSLARSWPSGWGAGQAAQGRREQGLVVSPNGHGSQSQI
jgi:hypothetical protein